MDRNLDRKLARITSGSYVPDDFIVADAKDADMAWGLTAAGPRPDGGGYRTRAEYLDAMRALITRGSVDIMLTSASNGERLVADGALGDDVTLAVRANDTTDVWNQRGSSYTGHASRPFHTASLSAVRRFCDLVLYSVTFNNELDRDLTTVEAYRSFRDEATAVGIRYFLEVFNPNAPVGINDADTGAFVNDSIFRTLAGVTSAERPVFLKVAYNGGESMRELTSHDPSLVVGVLGGSAGTTRDTYELLHRAQLHGARVALFGRKIQRAESQLDLVGLMRPVLSGELSPSEAVRAYHDALTECDLKPNRPLQDDLELTDPVLLSE